MTAALHWYDWSFEPTTTAGILALMTLYIVARRRGWLRHDDDVRQWVPSVRWQPWCAALGIITLILALDSPIDEGGDAYLLSIHMVQHLLLMMVAPPLLLLAIAGAPRMDQWSSKPWRLWLAMTRPWSACLIFNAVLLVWHIPSLYNTTLSVLPLHIFEHITFILAGVVFWWPLVDPVRTTRYRRNSPMEKIAVLVAAGIPPTILGMLFSVSPHVFYSFYAAAPRLWGLSPTADQQVAGVIMFGLGNVIYFVAIGVIFLRLFDDPEEDEDQAFAAIGGNRKLAESVGGGQLPSMVGSKEKESRLEANQ